MEYERIHKPQNGAGIISPSKLRAKLMGMGVTQQKKKKKEGSNSNSSRTSPSSSRLEDSQFVNDSLLDVASASIDNNIDSAVSLELPQTLREQEVSSSVPPQNHLPPRENMEPGHGYGHGHSHGRFKTQPPTRSDSGNSSAVHPLKSIDDENLDYDSNASSSSFEFHKGERMAHRSLTRSLSRPTSYKWNDAEKWIMSKQTGQGNHSKTLGKTRGNRLTGVNMVRVVPEADHPHSRMPEMKRVDNCQPTGHMNLDRFILDHPQSNDPREVSNMNNSTDEVPGTPGIQAISMRDMGTEMTPVTSLEPSRTATPNGSLTPYRSPISSIPSTPRAGEPTTAPAEHTTESNAHYLTGKGNQELSEHELKLKTRREIVALGVQLGKMNIAAWASKDEKDKYPFPDTHPEELKRIEFEKRAAAWEEAEKSKHAARYKREEIKIQAWESQQKVKLEEELRRIEAKVERLRTQSQAKMMKKIAMAREKSEQKRAAAEAQKARDAEKTAAQAEFIRQTGRAPYSDNLCCGLLC